MGPLVNSVLRSRKVLNKIILLLQGVLQEVESDVFVLVEGEETGEEGQTAVAGLPLADIAPPAIEEDEAESVMASAQDQREEELQVRHYFDKYLD